MIKYRKGYKYQLAENYTIRLTIFDHDIQSDFINLDKQGILQIKKGYAWDGPSGPTIDTKTFMRGSLVHDVLYQLIREGKLDSLYRKYADYMIREICLEDGMCRLRAWYVYVGLRRYANFAAKSKNRKKVISTP